MELFPARSIKEFLTSAGKITCGGFLTVLTLSSCAKSGQEIPKFTGDQCRHVQVFSESSGDIILGAEDFAIDYENHELFFSAYDRLAVERAVSKKENKIPEGNIYRLPISALIDTTSITVTARPMFEPQIISGGLRPHGISFDTDSRQLSFINRAYKIVENKGFLVPEVISTNINLEANLYQVDIAPCAANDIVINQGKSFVTFDHKKCDFYGFLEDVFNRNVTGVSSDGKIVLSGLKFANGIENLDDERLAVAATRGREVVLVSRQKETLAVEKRINVDGAPDNISRSADGSLVVAVHSSLFKLAFHRKFNIGKAPSRILKINPKSDEVVLLYHDETGEEFSAATVGVEFENYLFVGSVLDSGILTCSENDLS